jgi:hypothetical protein
MKIEVVEKRNKPKSVVIKLETTSEIAALHLALARLDLSEFWQEKYTLQELRNTLWRLK